MNAGAKIFGISILGLGGFALWKYFKGDNSMDIEVSNLPLLYNPNALDILNINNENDLILNAVGGGYGGGLETEMQQSGSTSGGITINPTPTYMNANSFQKMSIKQIYSVAKSVSSANAVMLTTMAMIESGGNPLAYRYENHLNDASYGLVQTLYKTALWLQSDLGYKKFNITKPSDLYNPEISLYFGNAFITWLKGYRSNASEEWIVRAYNGGQGWEKSANGVSMTLIHWNKYKAQKSTVLSNI